MSAHTKNVLADPRASLCVTEPDFAGAADARAMFVGRVSLIKGAEEAAEARQAYLAAHPNAYWASFGDFHMFKMADVRDVSFVGGFARAGSVTVEEYSAAAVDPCAPFAALVRRHMNRDHGASLKDYLRWVVGLGDDADGVEDVSMKHLDRFGFDLRVVQAGGASSGILRVPFDAPVTERKAIKAAIMGLSKRCAQLRDQAARS
jgi:putative heme iron utilization protein